MSDFCIFVKTNLYILSFNNAVMIKIPVSSICHLFFPWTPFIGIRALLFFLNFFVLSICLTLNEKRIVAIRTFQKNSFSNTLHFTSTAEFHSHSFRYAVPPQLMLVCRDKWKILFDPSSIFNVKNLKRIQEGRVRRRFMVRYDKVSRLT